MLRQICILVLLFIVAGIDPLRTICNSDDSCMQLHLNNTHLHALLRERCASSVTRPFNETTRISFIHIPKTGGSSITAIIKKFAFERIKVQAHEPFYIAHQREPNNLFITMLRDPIARAVSLFNYINSRKKLPPRAKENLFWNSTFGVTPAIWSTNQYILRTIYQDELSLFIKDIPNLSDGVCTHSYRQAVSGNTNVNVTVAMGISMETHSAVNAFTTTKQSMSSKLKYVQYANEIAQPKWRCREHLEIAWMLINHFSVVGVLEETDTFWKLFFQRAHINATEYILTTVKSIHKNRSIKRVPVEDTAVIANNLQETLYCSNVLWRIAGLINKYDAGCAE